MTSKVLKKCGGVSLVKEVRDDGKVWYLVLCEATSKYKAYTSYEGTDRNQAEDRYLMSANS